MVLSLRCRPDTVPQPYLIACRSTRLKGSAGAFRGASDSLASAPKQCNCGRQQFATILAPTLRGTCNQYHLQSHRPPTIEAKWRSRVRFYRKIIPVSHLPIGPTRITNQYVQSGSLACERVPRAAFVRLKRVSAHISSGIYCAVSKEGPLFAWFSLRTGGEIDDALTTGCAFSLINTRSTPRNNYATQPRLPRNIRVTGYEPRVTIIPCVVKTNMQKTLGA